MRAVRIFGVYLACVFMLCPVPQAYAEGEALHDTHLEAVEHEIVEHDVEHAEHSSGLPQFDPTSYTSQIFWLFLAFAVLYIFFSKRTLPEISSVIESRNAHIENDIETADKLRAEAEDVQKSYEESLEKARAEAASFYTEAETAIKQQGEKEYASFRTGAGKKIEALEKNLQKEKVKAMENMDAVAAEVARMAAEKITGITPDIDHVKTLVRSLNKTSKKAA